MCSFTSVLSTGLDFFTFLQYFVSAVLLSFLAFLSGSLVAGCSLDQSNWLILVMLTPVLNLTKWESLSWGYFPPTP